MTETKDRFVAFIDILGFKELVLKGTHQQTLDILERIYSWINHIVEVGKKEEVKVGFANTEIYPYIFSDSIILFTNSDSLEAGKLILYACRYILERSFVEKIPMKGAIAFGSITLDSEKSIYFGQALIDAYLLQEELKYYGLILHHSVEEKLGLNNETSRILKKFLQPHKTPTKSGSICYYNVAFSLEDPSKSVDDPSRKTHRLEQMYDTVSGPARIYVDNTIEMYSKFEK